MRVNEKRNWMTVHWGDDVALLDLDKEEILVTVANARNGFWECSVCSEIVEVYDADFKTEYATWDDIWDVLREKGHIRNRYYETLYIEPTLGKELQRCCDEIVTDVKKCGTEFDEEVTFPDGARMAIQVCGPSDPEEESCWTQGVVFDKDGNELGCTPACDRLDGSYGVDTNEASYWVHVIIGPKPEVWYCFMELVQYEPGDIPRLLVPWRDPDQYEHPFDFIYKTPEEALKGKAQLAPEEEDWILVKKTLEPQDIEVPVTQEESNA